ncbi:MAG: hypothetical protein RL237_896 [Actinomycetota bacterium]
MFSFVNTVAGPRITSFPTAPLITVRDFKPLSPLPDLIVDPTETFCLLLTIELAIMSSYHLEDLDQLRKPCPLKLSQKHT